MAPTLTEIERLRSLNLRQLLTRSTCAVNERIVGALRVRGFPDARVSHAAVLANVELRGSTVTQIADRALLPKQAISKMVLELGEFGYLGRSRHDSDGGMMSPDLKTTSTRTAQNQLPAGPRFWEQIPGIVITPTPESG